MRSIAAPRRDVERVRGDSYEFVFRLRAGGVPIPITGWSFSGHARRIDTGEIVFAYAFTALDEYRVLCSVSAATLAAVSTAVRVARYQLQWTTPSGAVRTFLHGLWTFVGDATP